MLRAGAEDRRTSEADADDRIDYLASRTPLRRIGRPEEIAFAVLFLASPQSSWTTGQILSPNGGVVMQ